MIRFLKFILRSFSFFFAIPPLLGSEGQLANANGTQIWHETFGKRNDPAFLLIMGGLSQGILWPTEFCEKLAQEGFYVIRYDHRDAGYSTCMDYEKYPYDLLDMAKDAVELLDFLKIEKAHLVGLSTGGPIAELLSVHYPERALTLTLMATSCDFRPSSLAFDGVYPDDIKLSRPTKIYTDWMQKFIQSSPQTDEEKLAERVHCWRVLSGDVAPFDEAGYTEIHRQFLARLKHPESLLNHLLAIKSSFEMIQTVPYQVKVPTLIFHGSEDPIFPPDHGEALAQAIKHAKYVCLYGMGHVPNKFFYDAYISGITQLVKQQEL